MDILTLLGGCFPRTLRLAVTTLLLVAGAGVCQAGDVGRPAAAPLTEHQLDAHDHAALEVADPVDRKLARYARQLPEMGFLRLYGPKAADVIAQLPGLLGAGAMNVDYEHDEDAAGILMELQMRRIRMLAREGMFSASLFKVGEGAAFEHPYLCVITLDTVPFEQDPGYATRFLTADFPDAYPVMDGEVLVDNADFLSFAVDHEVFHCLDAYFGGPPIKKTHDTIYSHYQLYVNEARADTFASLRFRQAGLGSPDFLQVFAALRTLSMLVSDLQHFTGDVINRGLRATSALKAEDLAQQVEASRELVMEVAPAAAEYESLLANSAHVVAGLGGDPSKLLRTLEGKQVAAADDALVAALRDQVDQARRFIESGYAGFSEGRATTDVEIASQ